ncbi:MAG TPA: four helix bundle protein [Terriglobales bacterium]|nr:four helix bundle protein [Terriglobales bacterium]
MGGHQNLSVWRKAMEFARDVYRATEKFPQRELYCLAKQLRRAAVSVPSNIAEGYGRNSRSELHQFVGIARGSLAEVETQLELAQMLGYLSDAETKLLLNDAAEIGRMLTGLREWSGKKAGKTSR